MGCDAMTLWGILAIVAGVLLILFWHGRNAVWGGATIGVVVGVIFSLIRHDWSLMLPCFAIGTFSGLAAVGLEALSDRLKRTR